MNVTPSPVSWIAHLPMATVSAWAAAFGTPLYVYDAATLAERCREVCEAFGAADVHYAMKANANAHVLAAIRTAGIGIEAVSPWEVRLAREVGFKKRSITYSAHNASEDELRAVARRGVSVTVDALSTLDRWGKLCPRGEVGLRLNLDLGDGHHPHVITAGPDSKFGLQAGELSSAITLARRHGLAVSTLHQHIGSGLFQLDTFADAAERLFVLARTLPGLRVIDVGGGFGVPYTPQEVRPNLAEWASELRRRLVRVLGVRGKKIRLRVEPGRYLVAESGVLLSRVTTVKRGRDRVWVGVDTGMHHLVRPALYGSEHPLVVFPSRPGPAMRCSVVGPICESGDVLAADRTMPVPEEGDLIAIGVAGAYGYSMASQYNLRGRPAEVLYEGGEARLIRRREKFRDVVGQD